MQLMLKMMQFTKMAFTEIHYMIRYYHKIAAGTAQKNI